jgi:hypothetical protein
MDVDDEVDWKKTKESRKGARPDRFLATARRRRRSVEDRRIDALLEQTSNHAKIADDNVVFLACRFMEAEGVWEIFLFDPD